MEIKDRIIIEAKKLINAPFCHSGRSTLGIDCFGLFYLSYSRSGFQFDNGDGRYNSKGWWQRTDEERLRNYFLERDFIKLTENQLPDKADICLFKLFGKNYPAHHMGIMLNSESFIHAKCGWASKDKRVGMDCLYPSYIKRLDFILRYKDFI